MSPAWRGRTPSVRTGRTATLTEAPAWGICRQAEREGGSVPRLLYIVSRRNQLVYTSLKRTFASDSNVEAMLDRRQGERPQRAHPQRAGHRAEERGPLTIEDHLLRLGWAGADARPDVERRPWT